MNSEVLDAILAEVPLFIRLLPCFRNSGYLIAVDTMNHDDFFGSRLPIYRKCHQLKKYGIVSGSFAFPNHVKTRLFPHDLNYMMDIWNQKDIDPT